MPGQEIESLVNQKIQAGNTPSNEMEGMMIGILIMNIKAFINNRLRWNIKNGHGGRLLAHWL